jgi:uncharacterized protein YndB with AHSA1/START domain
MTQQTKQSARAVADITAGTILATVEIGVPPARVFKALTDSQDIVRWWGSPESYRTTEWVSDLRVGGQWRATGLGADGAPFSVEGEYLEIEPPHKLVQTWKPAWDGGHVTTLTYRLDAIASGTRVTVRHEGFAGRPESCQGHTSGWESVLAWLAADLQPRPAADGGTAKQYFLSKLLPPRPSFSADMTAAEREVMKQHIVYWTGLLERGAAIMFGPVADPKGGYGVGVLVARDHAEALSFEHEDPVMRANMGFAFELHPMPNIVHR